MKIESIIKRKGGTVIEMEAPKRTYNFVPENGIHESPHVAEVDVVNHAQQLLRISEGFRSADGEPAPLDTTEQTLDPAETLLGSNVHAATYALSGGSSITLGELVLEAFNDSGLTHKMWNDLVDQERYEYIDATLRELQEGSELEEQQPAPILQPVVEQTAPVVQEQPAAPEQPPVVEQKQEAPAAQEQPPVTPPVQEQPAAPEQKSGDKGLEDSSWEDLKELYKKRFGRTTRLNKKEIIAALSEDD